MKIMVVIIISFATILFNPKAFAFSFQQHKLKNLSYLQPLDCKNLGLYNLEGPGYNRIGKTYSFLCESDNIENGDLIADDNKDQELEDQDQRPRYRSKLQRLNQAQRTGSYKITSKKKTKLKNRAPSKFRSSVEPNESSNSQTYSGLLGDLMIDEDYGIDSFLRGEYDRPFADDAAAPLPNHSPSEIVEIALKALRDLDEPTTDHGAAVFMRFCAPLSRQDRWGNTSGMISNWKVIMRGSLTPTMLARRLRASEEFSVLLDWEQLDVTKGTRAMPNEHLGYESTVAFVNAALFFGDGIEPSICQFTLKMFNGVWLIDSAVMNKRDLFMDDD